VKYLLLDTDAVSILFKPGHQLYHDSFDIAAGNHLLISFMTLAELALWPVRNNWGAERRTALKNFIAFIQLCSQTRLVVDAVNSAAPGSFVVVEIPYAR